VQIASVRRPTTHSTGLAMRQPFIIKVDGSPVNSGVRLLLFGEWYALFIEVSVNRGRNGLR
jgi:hypothetical protein